MKLQKSIIAIIALIVFAVSVNAQFGDLMEKVKKQTDKTKKVNTNVNTNDGNQNSVQTDDSMNWEFALKNTGYTGSVNEGAMRRVIKNGVDGEYGSGGLLVFTKQPFAKKSATLEDTVLRFDGKDSIYLTAFFGNQLVNDDFDKYIDIQMQIVTVGDVKYAQTGYMDNSAVINYGRYKGAATKVLPIDFMPAGGKSASFQAQVGDIARALRKLPKGVHIVHLRLTSGVGDANAVGAFYYDNSTGGGETAINETLKAVKMPTANAKFATLEKQIVAKLNEMPGEARAVRAVVTDSDWTPLRNEYSGVLIGRAISVVMAVNNGDGTCFQEKQTWTQDYNGSTYSNLRLSGTRERQDMACENVMK